MIDINTNAVPWYEYPASLFHAAGLTLREAGFVKLNGILTVMMLDGHHALHRGRLRHVAAHLA